MTTREGAKKEQEKMKVLTCFYTYNAFSLQLSKSLSYMTHTITSTCNTLPVNQQKMEEAVFCPPTIKMRSIHRCDHD